MRCDQYSPQWGKKLLHEVVREGSPVKAMSRLRPTMFPSRQGVGSEFWTEQRYFTKTGRWGHPGELGSRKYFGGTRVVVCDAVPCCPAQESSGTQSGGPSSFH